MIELANDNPLANSLCNKVGISRATYYRWLEDDPKFKKQMQAAQKVGRKGMCDTAESRIMNILKSNNEGTALNAAKFILNNNSPIYKEAHSGYQKIKMEEEIRRLREERIETLENETNALAYLIDYIKRDAQNKLRPTDIEDLAFLMDKLKAAPPNC